MLNQSLSSATAFNSSTNIAFNAVTDAAYSRCLYKIGNIAIVNLSTIKTQVYANATLFTLPEGFRPTKVVSAYARFVYNGGTYAERGIRMGCYPLTIYSDGRVVSNFNNEGTYWDIDVFFMFETV